MRHFTSFLLFAAAFCLASLTASAQKASVQGPDGRLTLNILDSSYEILFNGAQALKPSPLGLETNIGDYSLLEFVSAEKETVTDTYNIPTIKKSKVDYKANVLRCNFKTPQGCALTVEFRVSDRDVAFRYCIPREGETASIRILSERSGFVFPEGTTTFLTPQSDAMIGWKRTKPSYEEYYRYDEPLGEPSQYGHGYTFPCLFHNGDIWTLVSETGVDGTYCGSRLSEYDAALGGYRIAFPMMEENNGNGTVEPAFALPGFTPWRTITVGTLADVAETTVTWDLVEPRYTTAHKYDYGKGTWSWILWQDNSINFNDQQKYIDLAAAMHFKYALVDNIWDKTIGYEKMEELVKYAAGRNVSLFLWYSSSGWWNDIEQSPINVMSNPITRKKEMRWLQSIGVKGIKVDFFGGDKQETMRYYESILSDADDFGLMVIFHGCTLPRGWERMYPNYVGSEAVRASENLYFGQYECDIEARSAATHPFIRNTVGCMEFGGCFLNKILNRSNKQPEGPWKSSERRTTDSFQLATAVLFQNPIQNFALAPNNLIDAPTVCLDFLRDVPTIWDDTHLIDGYPGKFAVLSRRSGKTTYTAIVNYEGELYRNRQVRDIVGPIPESATVSVISMDKNGIPVRQEGQKAKINVGANDGAVIIVKEK